MLTLYSAKSGEVMQITFSFPDKKLNEYRKLTTAKLSVKHVNPDNTEDYLWERLATANARCRIDLDMFDKANGRFHSLTNLLKTDYCKEHFDKNDRTLIWKLFHEKYGITPKPIPTTYNHMIKIAYHKTLHRMSNGD